MSKLLKVRAADGMLVSFPRQTKPGMGARPYILRGKGAPEVKGSSPEGANVEVPDDVFVRRQLRSKSLVMVPAAASPNARAPRTQTLSTPSKE